MLNSLSLDLDGCLYNFMELVSQYFPNTPKEPNSIDLYQYMTNSEQHEFQRFLRSSTVLGDLKFYEGALEFIKWVRKKFKYLYIVTARDKSVEKVTIEQIKSWGIKLDGIFMEKEKHKVIPDRVTVSLEDDPHQLDKLKTFKYLKLLVPIRSWTKKWIIENIGDYTVYPYKDFAHAKSILEHLMEVNA